MSAKLFLMTWLEVFGLVYSRNVHMQMEAGDGFEVRNIREYFIAAEKVNWDYLPMGTDPLSGNNSYIDKFLRHGPDMIGSKYSKYVYKQYTNSSFKTEIPKPDWLGLLGPIIRGEVGEIIKVHFRNMADRELSMHPHGLRYNKNNEGALYMDRTSSINRTDDIVLPGETNTYLWKITERFAPTADDPNCIPWAYHSHLNPDREVNAGLLGMLLTCKQGVLTADGQRNDVDKEFILYYDIMDENESWLINENMQRCKNVSACYNPMDEDILENNRKYVINGYVFSNLPNLTACAGSRVAWHFFSLSESYHPVYIHGQTFLYRQHRASVIGVWPATFSSAMMTPLNPGNWKVTCFNTKHVTRGMQCNFRVEQCSGYTVQEMLSGRRREYFLAVEEEVWDYAPTGQNQFDGGSLTNPGRLSSKYFSTESGARIGQRYKKARYHSYTDAGFRTKSKFNEEERHLGILGPVIRAEVGDTIIINLMNNATRSYSILLHGVSMERRMEGTWAKENPKGDFHGHVILPGHVGTYIYTVPGYLAPTEDDPACLTYMYYSAVNVIRDIHSGLIGPLLICKPETLDPVTNKQKYIDKDVFLFYSSIDENLSWYIDDNIATYAPGKGNESDPDFIESNMMRCE
ncbi:hypothetical protein ACJMK2_035449 [Sinanodonta woodiana]|uniref:Uncharacterized protein n=1 Tax=Sinanodonta woodiana TaxID=1069815 RepID=A0ABD3WV09_SINWO